MTKRTRRRGQPLRPALNPPRWPRKRRPFHHERPRPNRIRRTPNHRLRFAGQVGLVQGEPGSRHDRPVRDDLVAGRQTNQIPHDHLLDRQTALDPIPYNQRPRRDERRQPIERPLGANLLEGPDRDVRDQNAQKERVAPGPKGDRQHAKQQQDAVRDRDGVRAKDARVRATGALRRTSPRASNRRAASISLSPIREVSTTVTIGSHYRRPARPT